MKKYKLSLLACLLISISCEKATISTTGPTDNPPTCATESELPDLIHWEIEPLFDLDEQIVHVIDSTNVAMVDGTTFKKSNNSFQSFSGIDIAFIENPIAVFFWNVNEGIIVEAEKKTV